MKHFAPLWSAICISLLVLASPPAHAQRIKSELVASGLDSPLFVTSPSGDDRLFILEQNSGDIHILKNGSILPAPFLDLTGKISTGGERGLLGMAFHPDYALNGFFYVNYTDNTGGDTVVSRFTVSANPDVASASSEVILLNINQPFSNHNGGMIAFGPNDGYLYIGMGDGGSAGDPLNNAQDGGELLGKILRIDVDSGIPYGIPPDNPFVGPGNPLDEIWAAGVRNPWRFSFDRDAGDLFIADVGQNLWEEVDYQSASSTGGENYGWRLMEGNHCFNPPNNCNPGGLVIPIYEYNHSEPGSPCSITGGYVYRGSAIPGLQGTYFLADFCSARIKSFRYDGQILTEFRVRTSELAPGDELNIIGISSFGEDAEGELYIIDNFDGEVFKIVPDLMMLSSDSIIAGQNVTLTVKDATPGSTVFFGISIQGEGQRFLPRLDVTMALDNPRLLGTDQADGSGTAQLTVFVPPAASGRTLWLQAAENGNTSNVLTETVQ